MAHYLLAATPIPGHVLPMLRIGADLRRRGHDVCLLTGDRFRETAAPQGFVRRYCRRRRNRVRSPARVRVRCPCSLVVG